MSSASQIQQELQSIDVSRGRLWLWFSPQWRQFKNSWRVFSMNRLAVFGVILIIFYAVMSVAHPILMRTVWTKGVYDPTVGYDLEIFPHPSPPSENHLLGTDTLGRDVLSRLLAATTPTFVLAFTAALTTALIGTLSGAFSAYFGGLIGALQAHLSDVFLLAPAPLIMVVIGGTVEISPIVFGLIYGLIAGLGGAAIVMHSQALSIVNKPYIEAAQVAGASGIQIIFKHLIPNILPLAAVQMLISVTGAVFADGFSTFLGLSRTRLNWGSMIYDAFTYRAVNSTITWNVLLPAALAISTFAAAFYFIARGLHEVAEPRLRSWGVRPAKTKFAPSILHTKIASQQASPEPSTEARMDARMDARLEDTSPVRVAPPEVAAAPPDVVQPASMAVAKPKSLILDDERAFAWLENLAVLHGAHEGLLLTQDRRRQSPPEWVLTTGIPDQPAQAPSSNNEEAKQAIARGDAYLQEGNLQQALDAYSKAEKLLNK